MEYKEALKELGKNDLTEAVRGICKIYEVRRRENFLNWIKNNPKSWEIICHADYEDITPQKAEEIMSLLTDSNIIELQVMWLIRCGNKIDILGKAIENYESITTG